MGRFIFSSAICLIFLFGCLPAERTDNNDVHQDAYPEGSFGYDLKFVSAHTKAVLLQDKTGRSCVLTCPDLQGRVLTSSFEGMEGKSLGYIDHTRIASDKIIPHTQGYGGEDRFWLGPQGGQFTIYFNPGDSFHFDNWFTPPPFDTEPFILVFANDSSAGYHKKMKLKNYAGSTFDLELLREIRLIERFEAQKLLCLQELERYRYVGFESINSMKNTGPQAWKKETGLLSIWILGMFPGGSTAVIPYKTVSEEDTGPYFNEYFVDLLGSAVDSIVKEEEGIIFFLGSGNYIGKIGVDHKRVKPVLGSYDPLNNVLTIVQYSLPECTDNYVNSQWKIQDDPYDGDVINVYNDGPLNRDLHTAPTFYELESSSPAIELAPGDSIVHYHRTFHFHADKEQLSEISRILLGTSIEEIESAFHEEDLNH